MFEDEIYHARTYLGVVNTYSSDLVKSNFNFKNFFYNFLSRKMMFRALRRNKFEFRTFRSGSKFFLQNCNIDHLYSNHFWTTESFSI